MFLLELGLIIINVLIKVRLHIDNYIGLMHNYIGLCIMHAILLYSNLGFSKKEPKTQQ